MDSYYSVAESSNVNIEKELRELRYLLNNTKIYKSEFFRATGRYPDFDELNNYLNYLQDRINELKRMKRGGGLLMGGDLITDQHELNRLLLLYDNIEDSRTQIKNLVEQGGSKKQIDNLIRMYDKLTKDLLKVDKEIRKTEWRIAEYNKGT